MSFIRALNKDPRNHRYIDQHNCVEYVFVGFTGELSQAQKKRLIKKHGIARKYAPSVIDTKMLTVDFGSPSWKLQMIYSEPKTD
jgi:hypothetical protein